MKQFKDPFFHMCLAGDVVASWSLTQEVAGLSPFTVMTNIFVSQFVEFSEKHLGKTQMTVYNLLGIVISLGV